MRLSELRTHPEMVTNASLLLLVAPVWFAAAAILKTYFGIGLFFTPFELMMSTPVTKSIFNLLSPMVFLGCLLLVLVLNMIAVFDLRFSIREKMVNGQLSLNARLSNILLLAVAMTMLGVFLSYAAVENFLIVVR